MLKVVNGSSLKGSVTDLNSEYFYHSRKTEEEYKQLIIDSQKYFEGIESGTIKITDNYYIYAPDSYKKMGYATDIAVIKNDNTIVNAKYLFVEKSVKVKPAENGYIFSGSDGRHRFTIAQKYGLKLLVDVLPIEKIESDSSEQKKVSIIGKIKLYFKNIRGKNYE